MRYHRVIVAARLEWVINGINKQLMLDWQVGGTLFSNW